MRSDQDLARRGGGTLLPLFVFRGEPFWGNDRIGLLEERLRHAGLARS